MKRSLKITSVIAIVAAVLVVLPLLAWAALHADYDGDGKVGSRDALYLLHHLGDPESYPIYQRGDVTGNGELTEADALYLLRHSLDPERYPLATEHEEEIIPAKEPTCTEDGLTEGVRCSVCGEILKAQEVVPATHTFSRWFEVEAGGCSLEPYHVRFCTVCGYFETDLDSDVLHAHKWVLENKDATCTEEGYRNYLHCVNCDTVVNKDIIPAKNHDYDGESWTATEEYHYMVCKRPECGYVKSQSHDWLDWVTEREESCTEDGLKYRECSQCHYVQTATVSATHLLTYTDAKAPTCTEPGHNKYEECSRCDYTTYVYKPELGHNVVDGKYKSDEDEHWLYCTRCAYTEGHGAHSFGDWETTQELSCTSDKIEKRTCSICSYKETKTTKSPGHVAGDWYGTLNGHYQDCIYCNANMYLGTHVYTNWTVEIPETCTEDGTETAKCDVCNYAKSQTRKALGHDFENAPWSSDETSHWHSCQRPGCTYQSDNENHKFGSFVIDTPAGCESAGSKHKICTVCEYRVEEAIPPIGHSFEGAKWENDDTHHWKTCVRDGCDFVDYREEHVFGNWTVTNDPTCTEAGEKARKCDCGYTETAVIEATGHSMSETYSISLEEHWFECLNEDCDYTEGFGNHEFTDWAEDTAPTCIEKGTEKHYCTVCKYEEIRYVDSLGHVDSELLSNETEHYKYCSRCEENYDVNAHKWSENVTVEATCEVGEHKTAICTVCDRTKKFDEGDPLGHLWANAFTDTEHYEKCQREGCGIRRNVEEHTMGLWERVKDATCTAEGAEERKCDGCDHKETKSIPVVPHDYGDFEKVDDEHHVRSCKCGDKQYEGHIMVYVKTVDVACESDGYKYYACNFCEHTEKRDVITAPGHNYGEWESNESRHYRTCQNPGCDSIKDNALHSFGEMIVDLEATCEKEGEAHKECSVCHYKTAAITIPATGHDHSADWSYDEVYHYRICANDGCREMLDKETHNTNGFGSNETDHWYNCTVCTKTGINIESHTYGEWKTVTAATCTSEGLQKRYCTHAKCGHEDSETKTLPMLDHDLYEDVFTEQVHEDGITYNHHIYAELCKNCDYRKDLHDGWVHIHDSVVFIPETPATCTERGYSAGYKCTVDGCLEYNREEIPALGHNYVDGVCTRCGDIYPYTRGLIFTLSSDGTYYSVTGIDSSCTDTDIIIPETHKGLPVKEIGYSAFKENNHIQSIDIPGSVEKINTNAFYGCQNLSTVNLSEGLKVISDYAFKLSYIEALNLPDSVTKIGSEAFSWCLNLKEINFGNSTATISNNAFSSCSIEIITIPGSMTKTGSYAFCRCDNLKGVIIESNVSAIEQGSFNTCKILEWIVIPVSLKTVEVDAFSGCTGLSVIYYCGTPEQWTNVVIEDYNDPIKALSPYYYCETQPAYSEEYDYWHYVDGVPTVWEEAESESELEFTLDSSGTYYIVTGIGTCTDADIVIPDTYKGLPVKEIGAYAFDYKLQITSVEIPDSVTKIANDAFNSCYNLTTVKLGTGVTEIAIRGFFDCTNLNKVYIKDLSKWCLINFNYFTSNPLYNGADLYVNETLAEDIVIPNGITAIKQYAFMGSNIKSLTVPNSVKSIGESAFESCENLTTVTLGNGIASIAERAFYASGIENLTIPDSVTTLEQWAFGLCANLETVKIGSGLETISGSAFSNCTSLKSVIIGVKVNTVGDSAFSSCNNLSDVYFCGDFEQWEYLDLGHSNSPLIYANHYFYSATRPSSNAGSYWRYVNGVPTLWA
ncbi:MAG: leucine-rich repeat protein [Clostridia bacterium]|nr:leucine-rich repeat protein [Clostridia bacterium]